MSQATRRQRVRHRRLVIPRRRRELIVTDTARADLDGIYDYIAADSPDSAARLITRLDTAMHKAARSGTTGVPRDWVRPGLRALIVGNYLIYFRLADNALTVIRVVHSAQDIGAMSFDADN